jgi:hypothetical protein
MVDPMKWWMSRDPATGPRAPRQPDSGDVPEYAVGDCVRLKSRPAMVRKIVRVEWHAMRHCYVYVVETNSERWNPAYWFSDQLLPACSSANQPGIRIAGARPVAVDDSTMSRCRSHLTHAEFCHIGCNVSHVYCPLGPAMRVAECEEKPRLMFVTSMSPARTTAALCRISSSLPIVACRDLSGVLTRWLWR